MTAPGAGSDDSAVAADYAHMTMAGMMFATLAMPDALRTSTASVPLTIIAGFLGAGKTTLLNQLLTAPDGRRITVVVNDFGSINIDAELVASRSDDMIGLTNGCACCAVAGDLTKTLIDIASRDVLPDAIVIEASGLADPRGIAQVALANPAIRLDGVLTVVDAETVSERSADPRSGRLFHDQLDAADLIVASKTDLTEPAQRDTALEWLTSRFVDTPIVDAPNGSVPADVVLGIDAPSRLASQDDAAVDHNGLYESWGFAIEGAIDDDRLDELFDSLPPSLLRAKGILHLAGQPNRRTIYQRVGARWRYTVGEPWGDEPPMSNLVLIGPAGWADRRELESFLAACGDSVVSQAVVRKPRAATVVDD